MKAILKPLVVGSLLWSSLALAHVELKASTPKKDAVLKTVPNALSLVFSGEVRVIKLALKDKDGNPIDLGFQPSKDAKAKFDWPLPKLTPSNYQVEWTIFGKDGHKMKGAYGFAVH